MKFADCLPLMTQMYLARTVAGILKDEVLRGDEERLREQIRQNERELASPARIADVLRLDQLERGPRILTEGILTTLLRWASFVTASPMTAGRMATSLQRVGGR